MALVSDAFLYPATPAIWAAAMRRATIRIENEYERDVRLNKIQRTEKIAIGYVGEFAFGTWAKQQAIAVDYLGETVGTGPDNGDFLSANNLIIDVKTQEVAYVPQNNWRCEVTGDQHNRPADLYVFAKLFRTKDSCLLYLLGWIKKTDFFTSASFREPGTILKNKPVHYSKWDVTIQMLQPLTSLQQALTT